MTTGARTWGAGGMVNRAKSRTVAHCRALSRSKRSIEASESVNQYHAMHHWNIGISLFDVSQHHWNIGQIWINAPLKHRNFADKWRCDNFAFARATLSKLPFFKTSFYSKFSKSTTQNKRQSCHKKVQLCHNHGNIGEKKMFLFWFMYLQRVTTVLQLSHV